LAFNAAILLMIGVVKFFFFFFLFHSVAKIILMTMEIFSIIDLWGLILFSHGCCLRRVL
jgi:hypothetical protein